MGSPTCLASVASTPETRFMLMSAVANSRTCLPRTEESSPHASQRNSIHMLHRSSSAARVNVSLPLEPHSPCCAVPFRSLSSARSTVGNTKVGSKSERRLVLAQSSSVSLQGQVARSRTFRVLSSWRKRQMRSVSTPLGQSRLRLEARPNYRSNGRAASIVPIANSKLARRSPRRRATKSASTPGNRSARWSRSPYKGL